MNIIEVTELDDSIYKALIMLIPQLSPGSMIPSKEEINEIVKSENCYLFVAKNTSDKIITSLTLVKYRIPTGLKVWIEDVVVDETERGKGIGKLLTLFAINFAKKLGAKSLELTSNPSRIAANQLYQKLGFVKRETNVYRLYFND